MLKKYRQVSAIFTDTNTTSRYHKNRPILPIPILKYRYITSCHLIHLMWMRLTRTSVTPLRKQPKRLSHAGIEITIFHVGMQSVNPSIKPFCSLLRETTQVWLLQLCFPSLTESRGIDGPKQFGALTSHTLVEKHGVF